MSAKTKKAWMVTEEWEGTSIVFFHHHGLAARRIGANHFDQEFEDVSCQRCSEFDQYSEKGAVPRKVLMQHGWWFGCGGCFERLEIDDLWVFGTIHCGLKCFLKDARLRFDCWRHNTRGKIENYFRRIRIL